MAQRESRFALCDPKINNAWNVNNAPLPHVKLEQCIPSHSHDESVQIATQQACQAEKFREKIGAGILEWLEQSNDFQSPYRTLGFT